MHIENIILYCTRKTNSEQKAESTFVTNNYNFFHAKFILKQY